jgi:NAD(P)H dehydrogenase (quinone)
MQSKSILIVYCHPYPQSFNHAILTHLEKNLTNHGLHYQLIDLYGDHFQPFYDAEELRLFHQGQTHDPLVKRYLDQLKTADGIIFVTPIWWNSIPGMLKGFIDKVMKEGDGLTHTVTRTGISGCLTNLKHAYVFTTSTSPTFWFRIASGNGIQKIFINKTLEQLGIRKAKWYNFGNISHATKKQRTHYLMRCQERSLHF